MSDYLYNRMFNPQYVNPIYFHNNTQQIQYAQQQDKKVFDAVKAVQDLCKAVKDMDEQHQQIAFILCLGEMSKEFGW